MKKIKKSVWFIGGAIILLALLAFTGSYGTGEGVVANNGLHWHPELTIYVDGEKQEIPANIGIGAAHQPMHTHAEDAARGVLHFEFGGVVRESSLRLGTFFRIWGNKDIETAFGSLERMTVNGKENTDYGDYVVGEKDTIELFYVSSPGEVPVNENTDVSSEE